MPAVRGVSWLLPATLMGGLLCAACSSDVTDPVNDPGPHPTSLRITMEQGDQQVVPASTSLPVPLAVRVINPRNQPVAHIAVRWVTRRADGGGAMVTTLTATDGDGRAQLGLVPGPVAGAYQTTAEIAGAAAPPVQFTTVAQVQGATQLGVPPGEAGVVRTDSVLATLAVPYRVLVQDHLDQPVPGVQVAWSVSGQGGALSDAVTVTDATGRAEVRHTLGSTVGAVRVEASVPGLPGSPIRFDTEVTPGAPAEFVPVGEAAHVVLLSATATQYHVALQDAHGNPINGILVDWAVTGGSGTIAPAQVLTANGGASAVHTLGAADAVQSVTATTPGILDDATLTFTTTAVSAIVHLTIADYWGCYYYGLCTSRFNPGEVVVTAGSTVAWIWSSPGTCDVVFSDAPTPPASSPLLAAGVHFRTFSVPGSYLYRCTVQSSSFTEGMVGRITVQ